MSNNIQECYFLEIKKNDAKNHTGLGGGMISFRYSRPLLIANAPTQAPYSRGATHRFHGTYFHKLL